MDLHRGRLIDHVHLPFLRGDPRCSRHTRRERRQASRGGYYAAFLFDPDDNNIEVVYHGPARRSAASVKLTF